MARTLTIALVALAGIHTADAQVRGGIFRELDSCAYSCSLKCKDLTDALRAKLSEVDSNCADAGQIDQRPFQTAYSYAYSSNGLNMTKTDAQAFADKMTNMRDGAAKLTAFQTADSWAYGSNGLNLTKTDAMAFGWKLTEQLNPTSSLECYKQAYTYAYSSNGLNLGKADAQAHAQKMCRRR